MEMNDDDDDDDDAFDGIGVEESACGCGGEHDRNGDAMECVTDDEDDAIRAGVGEIVRRQYEIYVHGGWTHVQLCR